MRFVAPARDAVDPTVFERPPLSQWREFGALLSGSDWPDLDALNRFAGKMDNVATGTMPRFVAQTPALLGDGLHYEQRIAGRGDLATREGNWHDLLNALVWLRFPQLKGALNVRQVEQIAIAGPKTRTRAQCALTLFDEAGVIVVLHDRTLLALWDAHDWHGLFWRERQAWSDGRIDVIVFGHALLEHALRPKQLLVGKAVVVASATNGAARALSPAAAVGAVAHAISAGSLLNDPQELRPLPLSGIPAWHPDNTGEVFYRNAPCFCPVRAGRAYPPPFDFSG